MDNMRKNLDDLVDLVLSDTYTKIPDSFMRSIADAPDGSFPRRMKPFLDYAALLSDALADPEAREDASCLLAGDMNVRRPLMANHGSHLLRPSNLGGCSLAIGADAHDLLDLPATSAPILMMDVGTLLGSWVAALLMTVIPDEYYVGAECSVLYRGMPGRADLLVTRVEDHATEIIEIKTTPSTALRAPDEAKPYQCIQAAAYALAPDSGPAERFSILTIGYHSARSRDGEARSQIRLDTYATADWKSRVDAEIDRLSSAISLPRDRVLSEAAALADATEAWRCLSCRFSACPKNKHPARFAL